MRSRRRRRSAEEARRVILDAAERRLVKSGPAAIRLQAVAADIGVSHPALLHHFGSRAALVRAVIERATQKLEEDLIRALAQVPGRPLDRAAFFERVFETLSSAGHARL